MASVSSIHHFVPWVLIAYPRTQGSPQAYRGEGEGREPFMVPVYPRPAPLITHGKGAYVTDVNGKDYLDFTSGIGVTSLGYSVPEITAIVADQAGKLMHMSNMFPNEWANVLAETLVSATKASGTMSGAHQVFLSNSGTESNEAALKFARAFGKTIDPSGAKFEVVAFSGAFHGRSFGSLSATQNPKYCLPFAPLVPGFKHGIFNSTQELDSLITDQTCAVIVEPVQGEGGIYPATPDFLAALRRRCDETKALLIFDEVQCGMCRTGSLWAHAHSLYRDAAGKVVAEPDILTSAKALGNGFPVGATILTRPVAEALGVGLHGNTYGGNPVASRVASYVVERLSTTSFSQHVEATSQRLIDGLKALQASTPNIIKEVRGLGLMMAVQLVPILDEKVPDVVSMARERGLLLLTAGGPSVRLIPPLIISDQEVDKALKILDGALRDTCAQSGGSKI
ncbi:hypothetical protein ACJ41O_012525 [Fusarium nematophilum]